MSRKGRQRSPVVGNTTQEEGLYENYQVSSSPVYGNIQVSSSPVYGNIGASSSYNYHSPGMPIESAPPPPRRRSNSPQVSPTYYNYSPGMPIESAPPPPRRRSDSSQVSPSYNYHSPEMPNKAPPSPLGRSRSDSPQVPSHRRSVFTYSPPSSTQTEWEQYYYYPSPDQPVTPGHDVRDSYLDYDQSPALGMRRQRRSMEQTTPYEPTPELPTYGNVPKASPGKNSSPKTPVRPDPPSGRGRSDSVFTYTPPSPTREEWEPYYYYPPQDHPVTPGHAFTDSYLDRGESLELPTIEEPAPELPKLAKSPKPAPRKNISTERPASPATPYGESRRDAPQVPSGRGSVISHSPLSPTQAEWEQQFVHATADKPVSPGQDMRRSNFQSGEAQVPGMNRQRRPLEGNAQQEPGSSLKHPPRRAPLNYYSEQMTPDDPNQTQPSIIKRLFVSDPAPSKPAPPKPVPSKQVPLKPPVPSKPVPPKPAPPKPDSRGDNQKDMYLASIHGPEIPQQKQKKLLPYPYELLADLDETLTPSPSSATKKKEFYMASPSSFPMPSAGRRRISYNGPSLFPTPSPPPQYPLPPSPLPPPSPPTTPLAPPPPPAYKEPLRPLPTPKPKEGKRTPSVHVEKEAPSGDESRLPFVSCCSVKAEFARRKLHVVPSSTPKESKVPFNIKSISPIPHSDTSRQYYDDPGSPSIYSDHNSRMDLDNSSHYELNRSFADSPSKSPASFSSPVTPRGRYRSVDFDSFNKSKLPTPPTSAQLFDIDPSTQHQVSLPSKRAPRRAIRDVGRLTRHTFNKFVSDSQMAVVMFMNSKVNPPGIEKSWDQHSLKGPAGVEPAFGFVDCAMEKELCAREQILSHPFFKLYIEGSPVSEVKDFGLMNYP